MAHKARLLELAIRGLKHQTAEIANEIDLLEKELALTAWQAGHGIARMARATARVYGEAAAPDIIGKRKRRRFTAAQKKAQSLRMKQFWAARKANAKR